MGNVIGFSTEMKVEYSLFVNHRNKVFGGAFFVLNAKLVSIQNCKFINNSAQYGGCLYSYWKIGSNSSWEATNS